MDDWTVSGLGKLVLRDRLSVQEGKTTFELTGEQGLVVDGGSLAPGLSDSSSIHNAGKLSFINPGLGGDLIGLGFSHLINDATGSISIETSGNIEPPLTNKGTINQLSGTTVTLIDTPLFNEKHYRLEGNAQILGKPSDVGLGRGPSTFEIKGGQLIAEPLSGKSTIGVPVNVIGGGEIKLLGGVLVLEKEGHHSSSGEFRIDRIGEEETVLQFNAQNRRLTGNSRRVGCSWGESVRPSAKRQSFKEALSKEAMVHQSWRRLSAIRFFCLSILRKGDEP